MSGEHDEQPRVDRPQDLPAQQSAVDPKEAERRQAIKQFNAEQCRQWFAEQLRNPIARQFFWDVLQAAGTFEERYGFGPFGQPNDFASAGYMAQRDLGIRIYHSGSRLDRAGVLSLVDEFLSNAAPAKPARRRKSK